MNSNVPKHIGITMDGNGRWGEARNLSRSEGHFAGVNAMEKVIDSCIDLKVQVLTLYAFSTENWSRPLDEVNYLMSLPIKFFHEKLPQFMKRNIRIQASGDLKKVPFATRFAIDRAMKRTKNNDGLIVNFAFNYGGRHDILQAIKQVAKDVQKNNFAVEKLTADHLESYLYTSDLPDPELLIRTGGEQRISNFLLWQAAHAHLYFTDVYFPDFQEEELIKAVQTWQEDNGMPLLFEDRMYKKVGH
ncbi:MAG TPA: isoprenyl transferase [Pseudogracilibacillus sp.]|nr:isoprenyl transferase [Pseudogracilibacillus sp.]